MPQLPGTDLTVSDLCLGGNVFGWTADEPTSFALLDRFLDAVPSTQSPFVDTAEMYGNGASETILGNWMAERGVRDRMVVATKASRGRRSTRCRRRRSGRPPSARCGTCGSTPSTCTTRTTTTRRRRWRRRSPPSTSW